jgi:transcription elongation factor
MAQQENVSRGSGSSSGQGSFVLDNNTYNVITILHQKSKGLEAYDKYLRDAQNDGDLASILERIRQQDQQFVQQLQRHLARLLAKTVGGTEEIAA